ncbi:BCRT domain-containing protein [Cryptosporidium ubiquitum]|uniref:BCRT domain-containing protein n=1 Tax=Cryptosporidium ubiquitum TaxID=857276 RepID=A0A1J4MP94_9CRYT|nr:BCRT domain-containing protein [Cryptosporidium ubiquitum]OII75267.1 BCRT domain-containing protein [Cryptosporidium ubiquitum]
MLGSNASSGLQSLTDNPQFTGLRNLRQSKSLHSESILISSSSSNSGSNVDNGCSNGIINGLNGSNNGNCLSNTLAQTSRTKEDDLYIPSGSGRISDKYWRSSTDFWNDLECGIVYPDYSSSNLGRNSYTSSQVSSGQYTHPFGLFSVSIHPVLTRKNALAIFYSFIPYIIGLVLFVWLLIGDSFIPAYALIMMFASSASSEFFLKNIFKSPRPPNSACASYGMPSSHCVTSYSILMWLLLENINALGFVSGFLFKLSIILITAPVPWARCGTTFRSHRKDHGFCVMSKDEDELRQCLLDELSGENIDLNTNNIDQEVFFNEDDEIKKFFESEIFNCSKTVEIYDRDVPKNHILSEDELKSILSKEIDDKKKAQVSSELVENRFNNNGANILNKIQKSNKEFIDNVLSFIGNKYFKTNNKMNLKRRISTEYDNLMNSSTNFIQEENEKSFEFEKRSIKENRDESELSTSNGQLHCFMKSREGIAFDIEASVKSNRSADKLVFNQEMNNKQFNELNIKDSFSLNIGRAITNNESIEEIENCLDPGNYLDRGQYFTESEDLHFSYNFGPKNDIPIDKKSNGKIKIFDDFQQEQENKFKLKSYIGLSNSSRTVEKASIQWESLNMSEKLRGSLIGKSFVGNNIPISFSTGNGKKVSINEESLSRARKIVGESPIGKSPIGNNIPTSFSTGSGKKVSINEESLSRARKIVEESPIGKSPIGNNIPISFSTGSGKKVTINEESLSRARKIVGESPIGKSPIGNNIPISFSTGSGKKVSINEESLSRARKIVGESPIGKSPIRNNIPISFSTGSGKKVSINEESLSRAKEIVGESPIGRSSIASNIPISFSTGSGKKVTINEESLSRARKIVEESPIEKSPIGNNMPISFSTGSGKKVSINEESLSIAKGIVGESPIGKSPIGNNIPISFSTGSGKKVTINEECLNRAKKLVDLENEIEKTETASNKDTKEQSLKDIKYGIRSNFFEKTKNNVYPNLLNRNQEKNTSNKKVRKFSREELIIPEFFKSYDNIKYSLACLKSKRVISPTLILIDHSLETLKKYTFLLSNNKEAEDSKFKYIEIDFKMICDEIENFFNQFPIFPGNMAPYKQRWFEIQYMLILYEECLKWSRKIKNVIKSFNIDFNELNSNEKAKKLLFLSLTQIKYPSVQKILGRICKRAIIEFFDAKRSSLIKICEGDFTISVPLNLRILSYTDKDVIDGLNDINTNRIMICTDGWYIVKIFTNFTLTKSVIQTMPRNIFVCGGNWLNSTMEHGHPLEIEASTQDFPLMVYGINLIRPIRVLSGLKLGFHLKPLLFRISKLVNSSEVSILSRETNDNEKKPSNIDKGGGFAFLIQVVVIHIFPICYKEMIETVQEDSRRIFITRDQNEMDISINNEIYEMYEKSFQQPKSDSEDSPVENTRRRISLESKLLVLDYWKFMKLRENNQQKIEISDLINNCSILTLPSGIDIDEITNIKPGTVLRLSWMKVMKNNTTKNLGCSFTKLVPSTKTSLSAKKRLKDDIILTRVLELVKKPVLTFENEPENIIKCKGGWPMCILGLILQVYPIEERKRGFEHCFEFKLLLLTSMGSKVFVRVHSLGCHDSDLRMCERINNKLKRIFIHSGEINYKDFIILIENTEFHSFERSTNLYYFNAKIPYSIFITPYSLGEKHFSDINTRRMLSKEIKDLSFYTKCNIPKLFDNHILENSPHQPICTSCENKLSECKCINGELIMLQ